MKAAFSATLQTCRHLIGSHSELVLQPRCLLIHRQFAPVRSRQLSLWVPIKTNHNRENANGFSSWNSFWAGLAGGVAFWLGITIANHPIKVCCDSEANQDSDVVEAGIRIDNLPTYTEAQVLEHNKDAKTIWVTYKEGVYDITEFVEGHPGGAEKILMAAGVSIEPFWQIYPVHYSTDNIARLESYRIANLKRDPAVDAVKSTSNDPFANDPKRHPLLKVLTQKPFNAESPKQLSADNLITPNELHFVRNHLPVPVGIDKDKFRLEIVDSSTGKKFKFTLSELSSGKLFPIYTIPVTLQCSGNKRKFMNEYEPVQGLMWDVNAISTAQWTGVRLRDVLEHCRANVASDDRIKHVQFEGLDKDPSGQSYGASVPKDRVFKEPNDVLLAFKMNGVDIPPDYGYPLRVVVPGVTGARSVKWLCRIVLSDEESRSHWQRCDYKVIPPSMKNLKEVDFSQYRPIQESSVQSGICQPVDGAKIDRDERTFVVKGYAFSGGGNSIDKVLVSVDGGRNWKVASLKQLKLPLYRHWAWTIWECEVEIPDGKQTVEIVCTAVDSQQNTQPETVRGIWNARGLMNNSWHRIRVEFINSN